MSVTPSSRPAADASTRTLVRRLLVEHMRPHLGRILLGVTLMALAGAATAANAWLMEPVLDQVFVRQDRAMLILVPLAVIVVAAIKGGSTFGQAVVMNHVGQRILADLQLRMFAHLMHADLAFFHDNPAGRLISRFTNDVNLLRSAVTQALTGIAKDSLTVVFLVALMFHQDWRLALIALAALWLFTVNSLTSRTPFIDPVIFRDPNYLGGTLLRTMFGVLLFGSLILLPPFVQEMGGYTVLDAGFLIAPRGLGVMIGSMFLGKLIAGLDPRKVIAASMVVIAATMWELSTFTEDIDRWHISINGFIQGLGLAGFTVPLNAVAFSTLPDEQRDAGTSFYSLLNNIGRSIGIAIFSSYLAWASQASRAALNEHVSPVNPAWRHLSLPDAWSLSDPVGLANLERLVARQGKLVAYIADFQLLAMSIAVCIPVLFFMTDPRKTGRPVVMGGGG